MRVKVACIYRLQVPTLLSQRRLVGIGETDNTRVRGTNPVELETDGCITHLTGRGWVVCSDREASVSELECPVTLRGTRADVGNWFISGSSSTTVFLAKQRGVTHHYVFSDWFSGGSYTPLLLPSSTFVSSSSSSSSVSYKSYRGVMKSINSNGITNSTPSLNSFLEGTS